MNPPSMRSWGSRALRRSLVGLLLFAALISARGAEPANFVPLDLGAGPPSSNAPASDAWAILPRGEQSFDSVPFRLGPPRAVTGMEMARVGDFLPTQLAGVRVGRKAARLILLHATLGDGREGVPVASLVFHYANGEQRSIRLGYGVHVRSFIKERNERSAHLADPNSRLVWTGTLEQDGRSRALRLFCTGVMNPQPAWEIVSVDFLSLFSPAAPFVCALTLDIDGAVPGQLAPPSRRVFKRLKELTESGYRREFTVSALDAVSGRNLPEARASLTITDDEVSFYLGEATPDAEGRIRLAYPPQQTVAYHVLVRAPGYLPFVSQGSKVGGDAFPSQLAARLEKGERMGGWVRDESGRAVEGAEVVLHRLTQDKPREYTRIDIDSVRTDREGHWSSTSGPRDLKDFGLQLRHPEFRPVTYAVGETQRVFEMVSRAELRAGQAVLSMQPGARLQGLVQSSAGVPVPGAEIYLQTRENPEPVRIAQTDVRGSFGYLIPEGAEGSLFVVAKGFAPKATPLALESGSNWVSILLAPGRVYQVRVQDQMGRPVPGATVKVEDWRDTRLLHFSTLTDEKGRFTWDSGPEDAVMFSVSRTNYSTMRINTSGGAVEQTWSLRVLSRVIGHVVDAETKRPIQDFRIYRGQSYSRFNPIEWQRYNTLRGRNGEYSIRLNDYSDGKTQILVEAPGYLPDVSLIYTNSGAYTHDFELKKGRGPSGIVQLPGGEPAVGATVVLLDPSENVSMARPGELDRNSQNSVVITDGQGRYEFAARYNAHTLVASHPKGFAEVTLSNLPTNGMILLQAWGRLTGKLRVGTNVAAQTIQLQSFQYRYGENGRQGPSVYLGLRAETDATGSFSFEKVPPGWRKASLYYPFRSSKNGPIPLSHDQSVLVKPGETGDVTMGGDGRLVVGHVNLTTGSHEDVDWRRDVHRLTLNPTMPGVNFGVDFSGVLTEEERQKRMQEYERRQRQFWDTEQGRQIDRKVRTLVLLFETNGTFRIEDVPPGNYSLSISPTNPERENYSYEQIGYVSKNVIVPPASKGAASEPFDLGAIDLAIRTTFRPGAKAPSFVTKTFDGKPVRLEDYRGKYVLLDFWATWAGSRASELAVLTNLFSSFGTNKNFAMLSLNLDHEPKPAMDFLQANPVGWPQCYLGRWVETSVPAGYGVEGLPTSVLIDPQGKIVARNLRGVSIRTSVRNALSGRRTAVVAP